MIELRVQNESGMRTHISTELLVAIIVLIGACEGVHGQECTLGVNEQAFLSSDQSANGPIARQSDLRERHYSPLGKPCVGVTRSSETEKANPGIIEHWVSVSNACGQRIKVRICYYHTQHCVDVDAPPWGREQAILGIFPALFDFRCDFTERCVAQECRAGVGRRSFD
jgi:hypothetical protein